MLGVVPSLVDYTRFHGMHIGLRAARRCIESFDAGVILFAPSEYALDPATAFPTTTLSPYEVQTLRLIDYYLLVAVTLTGLSTLLGLTDTVDAREGADGLDLDPVVLEHPLHPKRGSGCLASR